MAETVDTLFGGSSKGALGGVNARSQGGPSTIHSLTELPRVMVEMSRLALTWPALLAAAPRGDGHPVMVLPGFTAGDDSMLMLRRLLTQLDYKALPWLQGNNIGHPRLLEGAMRRFYRLHHAFDTKISLVGQSLGGVFAREIAREFPDAVRCVVTLGSPFAGGDDSPTNPAMEKLFEQLSGLTIDELRAQRPLVMNTDPLPMPTTAIYSKEDGVVAWSSCIEEEDDISENIRVFGSHSGMAMNPDVVRVVADRLAQDPAEWEKFDYASGCNRWVYPRC